MLLTIFLILFLIWALGLATSFTMGGFVHLPLVVALMVLLAVALVMLVIKVVQGRRV